MVLDVVEVGHVFKCFLKVTRCFLKVCRMVSLKLFTFFLQTPKVSQRGHAPLSLHLPACQFGRGKGVNPV